MKREELENKGYRQTKDGLFMINKDADIWKIGDDGQWKPATISLRNGYKATTSTYHHVFNQIYLHKALAEAFLPNPNNYNNVLFRDGNRQNVSLGNIFWGNASIRAKMRAEKSLIYGCSICGSTKKRSLKKTYVCVDCKRLIRKKEMKEAERIRSMQEAAEYFEGIDAASLCGQKKQVYELKLQGLKDIEIARQLGLSRQCVYQIVKALKEKRK